MPADEINEAVGVDLAAILTRAMAQNPAERYATAAEFREALRQIGRAGEVEIDYVVRSSEIEPPVVEVEETAVFRTLEGSSTGRLGSHAVAALFVILLAAFGIFCGYYPWKIPAASPRTVVSFNRDSLPSVEPARVNANRRPPDQKSGPPKGYVQARLASLPRVRKSVGRS
jgi:hypothetical protein